MQHVAIIRYIRPVKLKCFLRECYHNCVCCSVIEPETILGVDDLELKLYVHFLEFRCIHDWSCNSLCKLRDDAFREPWYPMTRPDHYCDLFFKHKLSFLEMIKKLKLRPDPRERLRASDILWYSIHLLNRQRNGIRGTRTTGRPWQGQRTGDWTSIPLPVKQVNAIPQDIASYNGCVERPRIRSHD
jgi:hypothetical protein